MLPDTHRIYLLYCVHLVINQWHQASSVTCLIVMGRKDGDVYTSTTGTWSANIEPKHPYIPKITATRQRTLHLGNNVVVEYIYTGAYDGLNGLALSL